MKASGKRLWKHNGVSGVFGKKKVIAAMENYLDKSADMKVEIEMQKTQKLV